MSFDLESEASLGSFGAPGSSYSSRSRGRFSLAGSQSLRSPPLPDDLFVLEDDYADGLPDLTNSVSSRSTTKLSSKQSKSAPTPRLPAGYVYSPSVVSKNGSVRISPAVSTGNDERSRSSRYPVLQQETRGEVSPFDSVSVAGSADKCANPEFVREQREVRASKTGAALAAVLASTTDKLPPEAKRRLSVSSSGSRRVPTSTPIYAGESVASTLPVRSSRNNSSLPSWTGDTPYQSQTTVGQRSSSNASGSTMRGGQRRESSVVQQLSSARSCVSSTSKIIIDKFVLADMANTEVLDDVNMRVLEGKNVIVLKEGGSFEVVDEDGNPIEPVYFETADERKNLGFPPVTPRDLHDRLKRSSGGKLGLVKHDGDYRVVLSTVGSSGKTRRAVELRDSPKWKRMFTPI